MKVRIHRGAHEIGGSCIELEADGARIVLDLGRPLWAEPGMDVALPAVAGLVQGDDPSLLGLIISHPHMDHYGLADQAHSSLPVYIGEAAARILKEAAFFTPGGVEFTPAGFLVHRVPFDVGPFRITPYLNDHSAFDAYSMLVEAGDRRLFYSGDIRGHGRKAALFEELLRQPPKDVNVMLLEGTHIHAEEGEEGESKALPVEEQTGPSELDVEAACVDTFRATAGIVLALYSPQNVDRHVTMYRAARQSDRDLVVDLYTATIAVATGRESIPQPGFGGLRVYLPRSQRSRVMQTQEFERVNAIRECRIFPEELAARPDRFVMTFRSSMIGDLEAAGCLKGARAVWSLWPGYLGQPSSESLHGFLERHGIELKIHHSSGHAYLPDLRRLVTSLAPARVVPIHSFGGDRFHELFPRVERRADGEWWKV